MSIDTQPRRAVRADLLAGDLQNLSSVCLMGTQCVECREVSLGLRTVCPSCGGSSVEARPLPRAGTLWTFTVVRHKPPGNYRGPEPFEPFGLGLVELADAIRVMTPIRCAVESLAIGMPLVFEPYVRVEADGSEVVAFAFGPSGDGGSR